MLSVPLAWTAVLAAVFAAALFGQTARSGPRRLPGPIPTRIRLGMAVSMSGPWGVLLAGAGVGALTGAWLSAAAATVAAAGLVTLTGLVLMPR